MAQWNLVDALSITGARRAFYMPVASIPPGSTSVREVEARQYKPLDERVSGGKDLILKIGIVPPSGGAFSNEGTLPDPSFRLHAMAGGSVRFKASDGTMDDRLILDVLAYFGGITNFPTGEIRWWLRWIEAGCVPYQIIYENVDKTELQTRLNAMKPGQSSYGLTFPREVTTPAEMTTFITGFMAGNQTHVLSAEPGAYIGTAAADPKDANNKLLKLRARYQGHTDTDPFVMNPRELFHLIFGEDSEEARNHPLISTIDLLGLGGKGNESKTMRIRPPLRTSKRLEWEARQEIDNHQEDWEPDAALTTDRIYNNLTRDGRTVTNSGFADANKCNLFTSDIAVRAGFRVGLHDVDSNTWHYVDANSHANLVHKASGTAERVELQGRHTDSARTWGWKIENWMRAQNITQLQQKLNEAIKEEGRCFIVSGARQRRFVKVKKGCGGKDGICDCKAALRKNGIGHIVLVREVLGQPRLAATAGEGLQSIHVQSLEASSDGAISRDVTFRLGGKSGSASAAVGFIRLHLFELHPGRDPDTADGLSDLNVRSENLNLLKTNNEAADNEEMTHNMDGTPRTDNKCCHDNYPTNSTPTEVTC
ncbi:MAG TPA: hypothetical protein VF735_15030 [Pyrinomonadaceae bacterium]|jgi:hypothetical protein